MVSSGALANYKTFVQGVRISLPVVDRVLWQYLDLSYNDEGRPVLREFDFATACQNRELRNFAGRLNRHLAARTRARAP